MQHTIFIGATNSVYWDIEKFSLSQLKQKIIEKIYLVPVKELNYRRGNNPGARNG